MRHEGDEIHIETDDARAGENSHVGRYVLGVSLALAIAALSAIWITGALTSPQAGSNDRVSNQPTPDR